MTKDLYTQKEVSEVRSFLYNEQGGKCLLSGVEVALRDCHTDHAHDKQQLVRGVLYKQANMVLGKLENLHVRYLAHWYTDTLSCFLRAAADYLELPRDTRWRHTGWLKKVQTAFNSLGESSKSGLLGDLGYYGAKNSKERKEIFKTLLLSRKLSYNTSMELMSKWKH